MGRRDLDLDKLGGRTCLGTSLGHTMEIGFHGVLLVLGCVSSDQQYQKVSCGGKAREAFGVLDCPSGIQVNSHCATRTMYAKAPKGLQRLLRVYWVVHNFL